MDEQAELIRFGKRLKRLREQQRLSVADLAGRSGISVNRVVRIERGQSDPTFDLLLALSRGLGVDADSTRPRPRPLLGARPSFRGSPGAAAVEGPHLRARPIRIVS
jgi:transcriptional regulator with XRE-family HTH domain